MWLITPAGFYSIVEKQTDRGRDSNCACAGQGDLVALKRAHCPSLGRIRESDDTDYRYRATAKRAHVAQAVAQMVEGLGYSNFKSHVAMQQGSIAPIFTTTSGTFCIACRMARCSKRRDRKREGREMNVPSADAYGGVMINDRGEVQLREPVNHFGGYVWTFAKGGLIRARRRSRQRCARSRKRPAMRRGSSRSSLACSRGRRRQPCSF